jgi:hypothetical protein
MRGRCQPGGTHSWAACPQQSVKFNLKPHVLHCTAPVPCFTGFVLQAQLSLGTARGASALPRLTLRRVRSVGRWNHNGEQKPLAAAAGGAAAAAAAAAGVSEDELSPAAHMILKAGARGGHYVTVTLNPSPNCYVVTFMHRGGLPCVTLALCGLRPCLLPAQPLGHAPRRLLSRAALPAHRTRSHHSKAPHHTAFHLACLLLPPSIYPSPSCQATLSSCTVSQQLTAMYCVWSVFLAPAALVWPSFCTASWTPA